MTEKTYTFYEVEIRANELEKLITAEAISKLDNGSRKLDLDFPKSVKSDGYGGFIVSIKKADK